MAPALSWGKSYRALLQTGGCPLSCNDAQNSVTLGGICPHLVRVLHHFVAWLQTGGCSAGGGGVLYGMIPGGICPYLGRVLHHLLLGYRLEAVLRAVVVSSTGRLLVVPALIWGESYSAVGVALTHLFVASSNVQALRGGLKRHHTCPTLTKGKQGR